MLSFKIKSVLIRAYDVLVINASLLIASLIVYLNNDFNIIKHYKVLLIGMGITTAIYIFIFTALGIYKILWHFSGFSETLKLFGGVFFSQMLAFVLHSLICLVFPSSPKYTAYFYLMLHLIAGVFSIVFMVSARLFVYLRYRNHKIKQKRSADHTEKASPTMVIGGGSATYLLLNDIYNPNRPAEYNVKCIIDDDPKQYGMEIHGVKIVGDRNTIEENVRKFGCKTIIFSIPSCPSKDKAEILEICARTGCKLKTMPSIGELLSRDENQNIVSDIKNVEIEDLLGRDPIKIRLEGLKAFFAGKTVLVTGGGGSIGSELCRQIAANNPAKLIIFDIYENNAYDIQNELKHSFPSLDLVVLIGSVRDVARLDSIFDTYKPNIVFHAAAHKHVPLMEDSPNEAIKNNVFGTFNTVMTSDKHGVERFVLISTDKAVNPTNIMGATKRICEMIVQSYNNFSKTDFVAVRFGNVLGSNGSVIPLFKKQLEQGGPITVTHKDIIRYFMTIPEAVSLVLQAGSNAKGGEIFVLDMGKPVKILSLAENLIRLSGFEPYKDIDIQFTGLRPGEKLYEELLMDEEGLKKTDNKLIYIGRPIEIDEDKFFDALHRLKHCMSDDKVDVRKIVREIVPTYKIAENGK